MFGYVLTISKTDDSNGEAIYYITDSYGICIGHAPTLELALSLMIIYIEYLLSVNNLHKKAAEIIKTIYPFIKENKIDCKDLLDKIKDANIIKETIKLFTKERQCKEIDCALFKMEIENIEINDYKFNPECIEKYYTNLIKGNSNNKIINKKESDFLFIEKEEIDFNKIKEKTNSIKEDKSLSNFKKNQHRH
ncbi:hypothetical protein [Pectobacterium fontis]|uniref:Uncharacterized protein n=1 Tax=Pectobacterium fontis TaxID=2558042 RepID=A0A7V8L3T7_9GAMM|nr:hypothetical protein [Pectobacterium fontis]KHN49516.1 hypothetical protein OI69_17770 [Pectobacterium fontis]